MANALKNKFYPYIEKYINEYLHGFTKERIDIELSKGEITLEKMSLRPDTINKIMDEKNLPFWIKVGLITKIYVGASVLSVIGEIPLELVIDGVDIILSPSYKWIINNLENYSKNNSERKDTPNPLGNDVFNKKVDDFDTSIFNIEKIQEILTNNKRNPKLCKLSQNFLKGLQIKKYNKALEFILSINQTFKDKNVRNVNLSPLNPKVTSNHCYIFISGFLSETSDHYEEWENMALNISAHNTCYFYNWPGDTLSNAAGETILNLGLTVLTNLAKSKNKNKDEDCTISNKNKNQEKKY